MSEIGDLFEAIATIANSGGLDCRDALIAAAFVCGVPMREIAEQFGFSRERARQILKFYGLTAGDGGHKYRLAETSQARAQKRERRMDRYYLRVYGCDHATVMAINQNAPLRDRSSPCFAYQQFKYNARRRRIEFTLTLPEWWEIWRLSGKWNERGRGKPYAITRIDYEKGFVQGNVRVSTYGEAISASFEQARADPPALGG